MSKILDRHAPERTQRIILRPHAPWYSDDLRKAKQEKRRCERIYVKSGLTVHKEIFNAECDKYKDLLIKAKTNYHKTKLAGLDHRQLFREVDKLCSSAADRVLPSSESEEKLANDFATFFMEKIERVKNKLDNLPSTYTRTETPLSESQLPRFTEVSLETVRKVVMKSPSSSCHSDCIPTWLLKECLEELLPAITRIVNSSLLSGKFPSSYKLARVTPLIKKVGKDPEDLNNYRPISNLKFLSKVVERVAMSQLQEYMQENGLYGKAQSAYRKNHSTESALLRVHNDVLRALDQRKEIILVLLDLSAAFDTVDHHILLRRLRDRYGICGDVLQWFESYLHDRKQCVAIGKSLSKNHHLQCAVPQGSVSGPFDFTIYAAPLEDVISEHSVDTMIYADDTQVYRSFDKSERANDVEKIEECVRDIKHWTAANRLLLNDSKTEVVHMTSRFSKDISSIPSLTIGQSKVNIVDEARNLGVVMDKHMTLTTHVNNVCRSAYFAIHKIGQIRKFIDRKTAETLTHAFVTSRLDANNSLLYGLPATTLAKLQRVQNSALRLVTGAKKDCNITSLRRELHWLSIKDRIIFKLLLVTFKAIHGMAPSYICELITIYVPKRTLRSSSQLLLSLPPRREVSTLYYGNRAFSVAAPTLWNKLPAEVRNANTLATFKRLLKTHLFNNSM